MSDSAKDAEDEKHARLGLNPAELLDRIQKLRVLLPAFAEEAASARREAARLRSQNAALKHRVRELETRSDVAHELRQDA